tara:strand:+ start:105 stop:386 length:282 start_codon:yes stop_codon:yes gene_type:complete
MTKIEPNLSDIESLLSMLKPEQIAKLMSDIPMNNRAYKIDYSYRGRRLAINDTYFSSAISPHQVKTFEEYKMHDEGIRQQALSGIDNMKVILV